jgi:hypothetical protein
MNNRNGDVDRPARSYETHEEEVEQDVPTNAPLGWRVGGNYYQDRNGVSNSVVTRPADYVPYQSIAEPGGPHAHDPAGRQYPQRSRDERQSGRVVQTAADRRNQWNTIRPNPMYHPPGATIDLPYRGNTPAMPPPPPPVGGRNQAAGFMQHNPYPTQRPDVGPGPASRQSGPQPQPPWPTSAPAQGPMQGPPFATRGGMGPPPIPQAGVRGRTSDPNMRSATGDYGNSQARGSRGDRGGRR